MDEKLENPAVAGGADPGLGRTEEVVRGPGSAIPATTAADTAAATALDLNELQEFSAEKLEALARDFGLHLHPARSRHQHILDVVRAALSAGATVTAEGFLDQVSDSFAMLRWPKLNFLPVPEDVCVPRAVIEQYRLRPGQKLGGNMRLPGHREKFLTLEQVTTIEDQPAEQWMEPTDFEKLTPQFPQGRIMLENPKTNSISARAVDLLAPLGRGQRGLIVAPPRVGKTILLKEIAKAIRVNHSDIVLILLLVDERPEEVTDLEREIDCQIYHSNFDESVHRHVQVAELVLERAKRLVELKQDVVVLLDSITRLSRGYNNLQRPYHVWRRRGEGAHQAEEVFRIGAECGRRRQPYDSRDRLDRNRQPHGRINFRRIQGHWQYGVASRSCAPRETALSGNSCLAVRHSP